MQPIRAEHYSELFSRVFIAKNLGAYARLIYCSVLAKATKEGRLELTIRSKELADATGLSANSVK